MYMENVIIYKYIRNRFYLFVPSHSHIPVCYVLDLKYIEVFHQ